MNRLTDELYVFKHRDISINSVYKIIKRRIKAKTFLREKKLCLIATLHLYSNIDK